MKYITFDFATSCILSNFFEGLTKKYHYSDKKLSQA